MVSHGGVCVAHRSMEAFDILGSQLDKWTPDGVKVPVNMTEPEEDLKKLFVQHLIQKIQALPGNPDSRSSVEEREDTMVTQGGVCEATRPTEALDIPESQLDVWTDDGMIIAVNFKKSEEYLKNLSVQDLRRKLQALPGNPAQITPDTTLVFEGKKLDSNSKPLGEYGIKSKSSIQIVMKVHGG